MTSEMNYEEREDRMFEQLKKALHHLDLALKESNEMCEKYGQAEYGRNEDILEAQQAVQNIVNKF